MLYNFNPNPLTGGSVDQQQGKQWDKK